MRAKRSFVAATRYAGCATPALAATVTWSPAVSISSPNDISNPGGTLITALDFNTEANFGPGDGVINGIPFVVSGPVGSGDVNTMIGNNDPGLSGLIVFQVPEPQSTAMLLCGLAVLARRHRK